MLFWFYRKIELLFYFFVQDIIKFVVGWLVVGERYYFKCYVFKLVYLQFKELYWFYNNLFMYQVRQKYELFYFLEEWR